MPTPHPAHDFRRVVQTVVEILGNPAHAAGKAEDVKDQKGQAEHDIQAPLRAKALELFIELHKINSFLIENRLTPIIHNIEIRSANYKLYSDAKAVCYPYAAVAFSIGKKVYAVNVVFTDDTTHPSPKSGQNSGPSLFIPELRAPNGDKSSSIWDVEPTQAFGAFQMDDMTKLTHGIFAQVLKAMGQRERAKLVKAMGLNHH